MKTISDKTKEKVEAIKKNVGGDVYFVVDEELEVLFDLLKDFQSDRETIRKLITNFAKNIVSKAKGRPIIFPGVALTTEQESWRQDILKGLDRYKYSYSREHKRQHMVEIVRRK